MKYFVSLLLATMLFAFRYLEDIYSLSLKTIDGKKVELSQFRGKKMFFVILPLSAQDTTIKVADMEALQNKYDTSLVVIGIPSEEHGFTKGGEKELKTLYKSSRPNFILAEGMKVKKSSGAQQSPLFQWLTDKNKNRHFGQEVQGTGHKFFVDETGELYAVMGPRITLSNPVIDRILSKALRKTSAMRPLKQTEEEASGN